MYLTKCSHRGFVGPIYHDDDFDSVIGLGEGAFQRSADKLRPVSRGDYYAYFLLEVTSYGRYPFLQHSAHIDSSN
jgi:hypothetical protein